MNFKDLKKEALDKYYPEKYKAYCENIADLELSIAWLNSKKGKDAATLMSGSDEVEKQMSHLVLLLDFKKAELKFLEEYFK